MKDLEYVLFSAISLCFMLTDGKRIEARLEANGNTAVISFGVPELSEKGIVSKMEKCIKTGDFASPYQEAAFTYMYIKELCLSIGGDVTITNHVSDTRCVISVLLPCNVSEGEICLADDTEENEYLLSAQTELANVLIKYRN